MKKLLIVFIFILVNINLYSNPVDTLLAKTIAKNYFEFLNPSRTSIELKNTITIYYKGYPSYYIINFIDGGYIAVSANDATVPILMYSYDGEYKENDFHNPAYLEWMENYSKEIDSVRTYNIPNDSTIQEWNNILNKNFSQYKSTISVQPLLTTKWGQTCNNDYGYPGYNYFCPTSSNDCGDHRCDAGCGPIAMAQVMKYWMHPIYSTYSPYDWCNMPDSLTDYSTMTEVEAVAKLIRDCGDKAGVNYCVDELVGGCHTSLWPIKKAKNALVDDFGYSDDANVDRREYYSKEKWIEKLKNDLNNRRPIIYVSWQGLEFWNAHYFVFDGYNSDSKFHINWGWRDNHDGWFEIGNLKPDTSYNFNFMQRAIFNLHPDWYVDCNSVLQVLQIYESFPLIQLSYYNPVAGTIIAGGSGAPLTIQSDQTVHYNAYRQIDLLDGFTAENGSNFTAEIVPCPAECPDNSKSKIISSDNYNEEIEFDTLYGRDTSITKKEIVELKFQIYPNPFVNQTNILYTVRENEMFDISIYDLDGEKLFTLIKGKQPEGSYSLLFDASNLPNGVYICIFSSKDRREIIKLLKY